MKNNIINNFFRQGYSKINLFNQNELNKIKKTVSFKINFLIKSTGKKIDKNKLKVYHKFKHIDKIHPLAIKNSTRYIILDNKVTLLSGIFTI